MKAQKGFTLIELLVVIIVIGILLAVSIPVYSQSVDETKKRAFCSAIRELKMALEQYRVTNGKGGYTYPSASRRKKLISEWVEEDWHTDFDKYFDRKLVDPFSGREFQIKDWHGRPTIRARRTDRIKYRTDGNTYILYFKMDPNGPTLTECP